MQNQTPRRSSKKEKTTSSKTLRRDNPNKKPGIMLFIGMFFLLFIITVMAILMTLNLKEVILPGIKAGDLDLSLKTRTEAEALLDQTWNSDHMILLDLGDTKLATRPVDLGISIDVEKTAKLAHNYGRGKGLLNELRFILAKEDLDVPLQLTFDEKVAQRLLITLSQTVSVAPQNASLSFIDGSYVTAPGISGSTIDVQLILEILKADPLKVIQERYLEISLLTLEPEIKDLTPVLDQIHQTLQQQFTLSAYDPITDETLNWKVPAEIKVKWLQVNEQSWQTWLAPDQKSVDKLVQTWQDALLPDRELIFPDGTQTVLKNWEKGQPASAYLRHLPTNYVVQPGESLWSISLKLGMPMYRIMDANPGVSTNSLYAGMQLIIPSKNDLLPLPVIENKRIVISISDQHMWTYENGQLRSEHIISTGMEDSPTMAGIFQVQSHYINAYASNWDLWMPHFLGIYEAWPDFMNGIHGLPILSSGVRLWAGSLGRPASYGCIILDLEAAESLYYWAEDGVVVEILP